MRAMGPGYHEFWDFLHCSYRELWGGTKQTSWGHCGDLLIYFMAVCISGFYWALGSSD